MASTVSAASSFDSAPASQGGPGWAEIETGKLRELLEAPGGTREKAMAYFHGRLDVLGRDGVNRLVREVFHCGDGTSGQMTMGRSKDAIVQHVLAAERHYLYASPAERDLQVKHNKTFVTGPAVAPHTKKSWVGEVEFVAFGGDAETQHLPQPSGLYLRLRP